MRSENSKCDERVGHAPKVGSLTQRRREVARGHSLMIPILALAALAGIGAVFAHPSASVLAAQTYVPGSYVISCLLDTRAGTVPCMNGNQIPICSNSACDELVVKAHVEDSSGNPAESGTVIIQDCEVNNSPAPSAACDSGSGTWSHIIQMPVDASGDSEVDYGYGRTPRTIGFRFKYFGRRSGIASGMSAPMDVTWF